MFVAALSGLTLLLTVPTILTVLICTKKSSTPGDAYKRYFETLSHMITWYESDLRDPSSKGRKSLVAVRGMHENAMKVAGMISQRDLALTQFGFIGMAIIGKHKLGLPDDHKALVHFWRVIGHLSGIQDRFNLFSGCEKCSFIACQELAEKVFVPGLEKPPEHYKFMSSTLLAGMWPIVPSMNPEAFFEFSRRLLECPPRQLTLLPTISLYVQFIVHYLLQVPLISMFLLPFLNFQMWLTVIVQNTVPILAFYAYRNSWKREA